MMLFTLVIYLFLLTFFSFCDLTTLLFGSSLLRILLYSSSENHTLSNHNAIYTLLTYWSKVKVFLNYVYTCVYIWVYIWVPGILTRGKLKWKPLFKKSSYFGLYRSCRNQHLNK